MKTEAGTISRHPEPRDIPELPLCWRRYPWLTTGGMHVCSRLLGDVSRENLGFPGLQRSLTLGAPFHPSVRPLPRTKRAFAGPDRSPLDRRQGRGAWGATGAAALPAAVAAEPRPFTCSALRRGDRPKVSPARQRTQSGSSIVPLLRGEYRLCNSYVHQGIRSVSAVLVSRSC